MLVDYNGYVGHTLVWPLCLYSKVQAEEAASNLDLPILWQRENSKSASRRMQQFVKLMLGIGRCPFSYFIGQGKSNGPAWQWNKEADAAHREMLKAHCGLWGCIMLSLGREAVVQFTSLRIHSASLLVLCLFGGLTQCWFLFFLWCDTHVGYF